MQVHIGNRWLEEGREQEAHELLSTLYHWAGHDPASATLLRDQVGAVVFRDKPKGTAAMSYDIQRGGKGHIVVYRPEEPHGLGEWVHELGHAAEDYATQQGILDSKDIHARYGIGRLPSSYGWGRPSEDFAECWVAVAGDGYDKNLERWAPEKHADIARVREALAR